MSSSVAPSGKCGHSLLWRRSAPTKRPWRVSAALAACIATAFSLGAQPIGSVPASAQLLAAGNSVDASTGCPTAIGVDLGPGQRCVSWPVSMFLQSESANGICSEALFMLVPLNQSADEYLALWNRTGPNANPSPSAPWGFTSTTGGPYGEEIWSTTTITPQNTGVGVHYDVPKGDGAWFVSAGGGACDLLGSAEDVEGVAHAWAVTYKREVSGTITVSGSSAPAPGITVEGDCNGGGGMTATDDQGHYGLLVDKGPCTVTPQLMNGLKATPESRSFDVERNVYGVDFQVPCGAVPEPSSTATNGPRRPDAALIPAVSSATCLQVFIKIVGPIPNVGTRSGLSVDNYVPDQGPVNFTRGVYSRAASPLVAAGEEGQQCVSGCANILVTVVNKVTHKPATNAEVNVELGAIDTEESPNLHQQGTQFLCLQTDSPTRECGTSLDRLKADENGQVRLLYWAPGELVSAHVELYAQACTPSACALKRAKSKITVYPYLIFHYQGELSPETVNDLVKMVDDKGYFDIASHSVEQGLEASAEAWMELLGVESHAVELALGPIGFAVAFTILDLAHATSELLEEAGLRGAFFDAGGLAEAGLGVEDPFAKVLGSSDAMYFEDQVLNGGTLFTYPHGWLWELGEQLAEKYQIKLIKPEPLDLSVYETSYCSQYTEMVPGLGGAAVQQKSTQQANCGIGYLSARNIRTDLCFIINSNSLEPYCGIQYDAPIWVASQEAVDNHLNHPDALHTSLP